MVFNATLKTVATWYLNGHAQHIVVKLYYIFPIVSCGIVPCGFAYLLILCIFSLRAEKSGLSSSGSPQGGSPVSDCLGDADSGDVPRLRISALPAYRIVQSYFTFYWYWPISGISSQVSFP